MRSMRGQIPPGPPLSIMGAIGEMPMLNRELQQTTPSLNVPMAEETMHSPPKRVYVGASPTGDTTLRWSNR